jgi:hypothetical protein
MWDSNSPSGAQIVRAPPAGHFASGGQSILVQSVRLASSPGHA